MNNQSNSIEDLLDALFEMVDEAKNAPLSSDKCIVERDRVLDMLDEIRGRFPIDMKEAQKLMNARKEYVDTAKREAELIRRQAEEEAKRLTDNNEVLLQVRKKSNDMIQLAEERSRELRRAANEYCDDALRRTEEAVAEVSEELKQARSRFRSAASGTAIAAAGQAKRAFYDAAEEEEG
ncbi:MAG: Archaeal/vacuolar-type H+-ATPase subunit [Oscillospiraceae bacterium]|nr:Archaeal/vacuolar-type H+-ATPase subunit [Oscillospiraceae bacterium]